MHRLIWSVGRDDTSMSKKKLKVAILGHKHSVPGKWNRNRS